MKGFGLYLLILVCLLAGVSYVVAENRVDLLLGCVQLL